VGRGAAAAPVPLYKERVGADPEGDAAIREELMPLHYIERRICEARRPARRNRTFRGPSPSGSPNCRALRLYAHLGERGDAAGEW